MNKHFEDMQYYLKRAGKTAKAGIKSEIEQIETKVKELTSGEEEPDPSRFESIREDLRELSERAEGETREAIDKTREKISAYRSEKPAE